METRDISQQINPVKVDKLEINISDIERHVLTELSKNFTRCIQSYDFYAVKNRSSIIKDIVNNIEVCYKENNVDNAEKNNIVGKILKNIKTELEIIDDLCPNKPGISELLVIIFSVFITYYKKILTQ